MILPTLRADQMAIARHPAETKVLSMGRRWGKTVMCGAIVGNCLRQHGRVAWVAPTYKNTRPLWRWLLAATAEDVKAKRMRLSRSDRTIETTRSGFLGVFSGDNIDSVRGEAFHLVVIDEAARIPEDAWSDAIMPTLADFGGQAILISTPKGKNWFYTEWLRGHSDGKHVMSWQAQTNANPNPNIRRAFDLVKDRVSESTYRQEWLAEFIDGGSVFRGVANAATASEQAEPQPGHEYVMGVDWAQSGDFTVLTVLDITTNETATIDRFNQIDYKTQLNRLEALYERFRPHVIVSEKNSMGGPLSEALILRGLPVQMFTTTNTTKAEIIQSLALAFEQRAISIIPDPVLINELQAYEQTRLPSGAWRYSAPSGMHDDTVMSLALAWSAVYNSTPLLL